MEAANLAPQKTMQRRNMVQIIKTKALPNDVNGPIGECDAGDALSVLAQSASMC
jgi:hypothetical protein